MSRSDLEALTLRALRYPTRGHERRAVRALLHRALHLVPDLVGLARALFKHFRRIRLGVGREIWIPQALARAVRSSSPVEEAQFLLLIARELFQVRRAT